MANKVFSRDYLINELELPYGSNVILDTITGTTRWSIVHKIVFEDKGKFYQTTYSVGATELQMKSPWAYDEEVECTEVELQEVVVKKWVPVKD